MLKKFIDNEIGYSSVDFSFILLVGIAFASVSAPIIRDQANYSYTTLSCRMNDYLNDTATCNSANVNVSVPPINPTTPPVTPPPVVAPADPNSCVPDHGISCGSAGEVTNPRTL